MAILVLLLWAFTAGAGIYLLIKGTLGRPRPSRPARAAAAPAPAAEAVAARAASAQTAAAETAGAAAVSAPSAAATGASGPADVPAAAAASRSAGTAPRKSRDQWAPPSLVAARQAPAVPGARAAAEFAHPAAGVIGLGFWLGFTLIHARVLGWIGFGLATATALIGLGWFVANNRTARQAAPGEPAPSFSGRLLALHGSAAALTIALAALTTLLLRP
jgi:hypothetical protein